MKKSILFLLSIILFPLSTFAAEICLHHECSRGGDRGPVCLVGKTSAGEFQSEFEVNDILSVPVFWQGVEEPSGALRWDAVDPDGPFSLDHWDKSGPTSGGSSSNGQPSDRHRTYFYNEYCADTSEVLSDGYNDFLHVFRAVGSLDVSRDSHLDNRWQLIESWVTLDGDWQFDLCRLQTQSRDYRNDADIYCRESKLFDVEKLDPELTQRVENARKQVRALLDEQSRFEADIQDKITEVDTAFDQIKDLHVDDIRESHIDRVTPALDLFRDLKRTLGELKQESALLREQFEEIFNDVNTVAQAELERNNILREDYSTRHPLILTDIAIPELVVDDLFSPEDDIYNAYADKVIENLTALHNAGEYAQFITSVKAWLVSTQRLRNNLQHETFQSPAEWEALTSAFERVEAFIFGSDTQAPILDRDLWFSDSPVTLEQREAIGFIKTHYKQKAAIIENEVRTWRGKVLTEEQQSMLEAFEALGAGINELLNSGQTPSKDVDNLVSGAAIAVKEGVKCAATVIAAGDFGDFYEVIVGKSICTGEQLSHSERAFSSLGLIVGNGVFWRGVAKAAGLISDAKLVAKLTSDIMQKAHALGVTSKQQLERLAEIVNGTLSCTVSSTSSSRKFSYSTTRSTVNIAMAPPTCISTKLAGELDEALDGAQKLELDNGIDVEDLFEFSSLPLLPSPSASIAHNINRMDEIKDLVGLSAREIRSSPGRAIASRSLVDSPKLLRGTQGNAGLVPRDVGEILSGRDFKNFDEFRNAFWIAVSETKYLDNFSPQNRTKIRAGNAPTPIAEQWSDGRKTYELHHIEPINQGGSVYDLSNLMIVTPRFHKEVLDRSYHYGR